MVSVGNTLNSRDHDMLVTLNTKVDQLTFDIKDIKDNLITRMAKVESRLDAIDLYHAQIPLSQYNDIAKWTENFRANLKFIMIISGISLSLFGAIIERLLQLWFKF
ncbi:MAG: hypothetical protein C5B43_04115 [Verrucomicrobia bacterium]|nr:MAG: hypothetical protein C5B43_04115 [Verrucomicrobiota bacterium]